MPKTTIGLVGPIASGKGTVIDFLKEKGFKAYSTSDVLKDEVSARGLEVSRTNCNKVSNELRESLGADILAVRTSEIIDREGYGNIVVDAIRNPKEIEFLRQKYNVRIIGVVAEQRRRYDFFVQRGTYTDEIKTWEQFKELDDRELAQAGVHKQQIKASLDLADIVIENNGSIEDLRRKIEDFLS